MQEIFAYKFKDIHFDHMAHVNCFYCQKIFLIVCPSHMPFQYRGSRGLYHEMRSKEPEPTSVTRLDKTKQLQSH